MGPNFDSNFGTYLGVAISVTQRAVTPQTTPAAPAQYGPISGTTVTATRRLRFGTPLCTYLGLSLVLD